MDPILDRQVRDLVGRSYAEFDCWRLLRHIFALRGVELPAEYFEAYRDRRFITVAQGWTDVLRGGGFYVPREWDVAVFRTHQILTLHVGVCLNDREFIHALDRETGVAIGRLDRAPWKSLVAGFLRLAE